MLTRISDSKEAFSLSPEKIHTGLSLQILNDKILHFKSINSTNTYLLGAHSHSNGTVVLADFQTSGRGRLARVWESKKAESLLFSIFLNRDLVSYPHFAFTFIAAISVFEALQSIAPEINLALKWPNDILINNKKVCGILVECRTSGSNLSKIVIGIGLNVLQDKDFFKKQGLKGGTSLALETKVKSSLLTILKQIILKTDQNLALYKNTDGLEIIKKWKSYCPYIGKKIKIDNGKEIIPGIFHDIGTDGSIIIDSKGKLNNFYAGDVTVENTEI